MTVSLKGLTSLLLTKLLHDIVSTFASSVILQLPGNLETRHMDYDLDQAIQMEHGGHWYYHVLSSCFLILVSFHFFPNHLYSHYACICSQVCTCFSSCPSTQ